MAQATLHKIFQGHTNPVRCVAFSPDSKLIASASNDKAVRLWNIPNGDLNAELKGHERAIRSVAFSPDGKSIVTGSADSTVQTWSVATKKQVKILNGHDSPVSSVAWSPNGDVLASGSDDTTVILWDAISGSAKKKLTGHSNCVMSVSFSQNGNKLASAGSGDKTAIIWDVNSGAALIKLAHSDIVLSVCFSRGDQFVVTGCGDKIVLFDANTGREEKRFEGHTDTVDSVACSFDGSMIASGSWDRSLRLWDVASTKQSQQLDEHKYIVRSVAFSCNGKFIASGSDDKTVCLWNAPLLLQHHVLPEMNKIETETQQKQNAAEIEKTKELEKQKQEQLAKTEKELLAKQAETERQQKITLEMEKKQQELEKKEEELLAKQQEIADRERKQREELEKQKKQEEGEEAKKIKATLDPTQFAKWTVDDVCVYLKQAEIDDDVIAIFKKQKVKGKWLDQYAKADKLKSIGIEADGDHLDVIDAINKLVSPSRSANTGLKLHEIPRSQLIKNEQLNDGYFGVVFSGIYNGIPVAIKRPKLVGANLDAKQQLADIVEEGTVMSSIPAHPNVVQCFGISRVNEQDIELVVEFCSLGSLDQFLKKNNSTPSEHRLNLLQQTARGLDHLNKHNIVHRDVAARNVLLRDQDGIIIAKVADFGLSRVRGDGEYYFTTGKHLVAPETAPEAEKTGKHSTRSDVWSFGVLLWEVESLCATRANPNKTAFPPLARPAQASNKTHDIMLKCWAIDPHERPSFEALIDMLA